MAAIVPVGSARMQQARGDRILFSTSNDNVMMNDILNTHTPDGREFDVKPILLIIEDVVHHANAPLPGTILSTTLQGTQAQLDALDEKALHSGFADAINKISCELSSGEGGWDAQATTMSLFNTLSLYPWDVKVVVALAAFAVIYDKFGLVSQNYPTNPLTESVAQLKQLPDTMEQAEPLKSLANLIKAVIDLTKCIVDFKSLPSQYISPDTPELAAATAHIPIAVYWTIRSIVACAFIVMNQIGSIREYITATTEAWELYGLARKVNNIHTHLNKQLLLCHDHIAMIKHDEAYRTLVRLFETPHFDNTKVLKALIYPQDDQLPLFESSTKRRVSIETLRRKIVLLLISELDFSTEELSLFDSMYREAKQNPSRPESHHEVVWLPITDRSVPWNQEKQQLFENSQNLMPWLSLHHPSMLDPAAIKYIKDYWHFTKKPIVVVLDQQGKVVNLNALHMMWIWGSLAYPFTSLKEEQLWKEESWKIELLADSIEPMIFNWINEGKYICLYGGEDIDWIRKFTTTAQAVARAANIPLEMLYVGKGNPRDKIRKNNTIIVAENLSHVLPDLTLIWLFWIRLESMWHSKVQHGKSVENDQIMQEIMMMLSFDGSDQGWAVISRGTGDMAKGKGELFLMSLSQFDQWKGHIEEKGFLPALNNHIQELHTTHHCNRLIQSTHSPDGREFDVKPILLIIEDVMHRATAPLPGTILSTTLQGTQAQLDAVDEKALHSGFSDILELLAYTINKISCEISCKCSGGGDAHATTVALFTTLSNYPWDAKVVVALAAFAVIYGEFWLVAQLYPTNPLAKSIAHLKQLPDIMERAESLKPKFEALSGLIKAMLDLTKCIVEFKSLPSQYISPDTPEMVTATAHIPIAVYWTIRSIVACASIIMNLIGISHEYIASTTEAWELSSLAHKVNNIHSHLNKQLSLCHQHIAMMKHDEAYRTLVRLFETPHIDNMKVLKALIYPKEDQLPLFESSTKRRVSIETLRRKIVLLLISELDFSTEELSLFDSMYREAKQNPSRPESHHEVVWLPITDRSVPWNQEKQQLFENSQNLMPWLSLHHPSMLDPAAIKYIKDYWHFTKKPIVVVLDQQGKVVNLNALHMMWIWGSLAYPFTSLKEEQLWKEESWKIELLADSIEPMIFNWINEGKYICLYGGEDIDWIRKFTTTAQAVARKANLSLKMLYVGRSNPGDKIRKINRTIVVENLSHVLPDPTLIWFFWSRLESMWHSKVQHEESVENDEIMKEIMMMLYFDGSDQGWAVMSRGTGGMAKAKGEMFVKSLIEFDEWKHDIEEKGFLPALNDYFQKLYTPHHCHRFILPRSTGSAPGMVVCAECGRAMAESIMYTCCWSIN